MKMKVTKKTERTSKTEKCTKTYKVSGSNGDGGDGNQQFITVDKTITLPPSNADKVCTTLHMILPIQCDKSASAIIRDFVGRHRGQILT